METLTNYPTDTYRGTPRAVRLILCELHDYLTFSRDCSHTDLVHTSQYYGIIGSDYGHLHNTSGGWRLWKSPSPAYAMARQLRGEK